jgi:hypothetical protein
MARLVRYDALKEAVVIFGPGMNGLQLVVRDNTGGHALAVKRCGAFSVDGCENNQMTSLGKGW